MQAGRIFFIILFSTVLITQVALFPQNYSNLGFDGNKKQLNANVNGNFNLILNITMEIQSFFLTISV
jgi:hypothetical protein